MKSAVDLITRRYDRDLSLLGPARATLAALPLSADLHADAELVISELLTNAILHGGEDGEVELTLRAPSPRTLLVEVTHSGPAYDLEAELHCPPQSTDGRGLMIVTSLSVWLEATHSEGRTCTRCLLESAR